MKKKSKKQNDTEPRPTDLIQTWRPIHTAPKGEEVDLWLEIPASARSMGIQDAFRICDACWMSEVPESEKSSLRDSRLAGWYHVVNARNRLIRSEYITHWRPVPKSPKGEIDAAWENLNAVIEFQVKKTKRMLRK